MAVLFLCYHFSILCTSKGDISASAISFFSRFVYKLIVVQVLLLLRSNSLAL